MQETGYFHFFLLLDFHHDFQHCLLDNPLNLFEKNKVNYFLYINHKLVEKSKSPFYGPKVDFTYQDKS